MPRRQCAATLDLYDETYRCDRKRHHGKHRARYTERMYGADELGQYAAKLSGGTLRWRRVRDRRPFGLL